MKTTFGEFLATRRKEKNLKQKDLAKMLYVSESTVAKWEQNRANPDITVVSRLAEILEVSEHELITASIDNDQREKNKMALNWKNLIFSWNLFFIISYSITLLTCFICNLAVNHTLSWFWIVLSGLMLTASLITLPHYIKKFKLLILSVAPLLSLILLLGICCIYINGNWFWVTTLPTVASFLIIFLPLYISKYNLPRIIKKFNFIFCALIDCLILILSLYVIEDFSLTYNYTNLKWCTNFALPIFLCGFAIIILIISIFQFKKLNAFQKLCFALSIIAVIYLPSQIFVNTILFNTLGIQKPLTYKPNFSLWTNPYINNNISVIIIASLIFLSIVFGIAGFLKSKKSHKNDI